MKAEVERKGIIHSESSCSACLAWDLRDSSSSLEQNVLQQFGFFFLNFQGVFSVKSEDLKAGSAQSSEEKPSTSFSCCQSFPRISVSCGDGICREWDRAKPKQEAKCLLETK